MGFNKIGGYMQITILCRHSGEKIEAYLLANSSRAQILLSKTGGVFLVNLILACLQFVFSIENKIHSG